MHISPCIFSHLCSHSHTYTHSDTLHTLAHTPSHIHPLKFSRHLNIYMYTSNQIHYQIHNHTHLLTHINSLIVSYTQTLKLTCLQFLTHLYTLRLILVLIGSYKDTCVCAHICFTAKYAHMFTLTHTHHTNTYSHAHVHTFTCSHSHHLPTFTHLHNHVYPDTHTLLLSWLTHIITLTLLHSSTSSVRHTYTFPQTQTVLIVYSLSDIHV